MNQVVKLVFVLTAICVTVQPTRAAEINILSLESLKPSLERLMPSFEKTTGHTVKLNYGNSSTLPKRFAANEPFDVALASTPLIERLTKDGKVAAESKIDIARVAIGVGVKKGATKPDISTTTAFTKALLAATSVSHASEGPSGVYLNALLKRLGIEAEIKAKLRPVAGGPLVMGPVAKGDVELGIITIPHGRSKRGIGWATSRRTTRVRRLCRRDKRDHKGT